MNNKIKVLHILWSGHSGGAEKFLLDITIYSDNNIFHHEVCFLSQGGRIAKQMAKNNTRLYYLRMKSGFSIINALKLLAVINKTKPHIIHNHVRNYLANALILLFFRIPKVYFEHGGNLIGKNPKREIIFYNYFGRFYDLILANSNYVKLAIIKLTKVIPTRVKIFYIGLDIEQYKNNFKNQELKTHLGIPRENRVIGMVGRLVDQKGIDDFIKVASRVNNLCDRCSFIIAGEGENRSALEKMSLTFNVDVKFLGDRHDVPQLLTIFDIFLITSKWEPFGITILEAMAAKVPIVGFAVPGMKETFEKGGGGILIKERNHQELAKIIVNLLENTDQCIHLSNKGFSNIEQNFNIKNNIKELEKEYSLIIKNPYD